MASAFENFLGQRYQEEGGSHHPRAVKQKKTKNIFLFFSVFEHCLSPTTRNILIAEREEGSQKVE